MQRVFLGSELLLPVGGSPEALKAVLAQWRRSGIRVYVLAKSPIGRVKSELEASGLSPHVDEVLTSESEGLCKLIQRKIEADGWIPTQQLLVHCCLEDIQGVFMDDDGDARPTPLAHTVRLSKAHELNGLQEPDLQLVGTVLASAPGPSFQHVHVFEHAAGRRVDEEDSSEKCMVDSLPTPASRKQILAVTAKTNPKILQGRPDFDDLLNKKRDSQVLSPTSPTSPGGSAEAGLLPASPSGKGKGKGPPVPPPGAVAAQIAAQKAKQDAGPLFPEGTAVEITSPASLAGERGVVQKVTGEGPDARWRVTLRDGTCKWAEGVQAAPAGQAAEATSAQPAQPGSAAAMAEAALSAMALGGAQPQSGEPIKVLSGNHAGKQGVVLKAPTEDDKRWRVLLHGVGPTWVNEVEPADMSCPNSPKAPGRGRQQESSADGQPGPGAEITIRQGPHAGRRGTVLRVAGEGPELRWRVKLADSDDSTWTTDVEASAGGGPAQGQEVGTPSSEIRVEVKSGQYAGQFGTALKVQGEGEDQKWRVHIDGTTTVTWCDNVRVLAAGNDFTNSPPRRPDAGFVPPTRGAPPLVLPAPNPNSYLVDNSDSEASDPEMPELEPL